jgi:hypothetical protein
MLAGYYAGCILQTGWRSPLLSESRKGIAKLIAISAMGEKF